MICNKTIAKLIFAIKYISIKKQKQENKDDEFSSARSLQSLLFFLLEPPAATLNFLLFSLFFWLSLLFFFSNGSPFCFFHVCFFYILELGQPKAYGRVSSFLKNLGSQSFCAYPYFIS